VAMILVIRCFSSGIFMLSITLFVFASSWLFTKIIDADLLKISPASFIVNTTHPFSKPISLLKTPEILKVLFAI
jgi:hypothetical protein